MDFIDNTVSSEIASVVKKNLAPNLMEFYDDIYGDLIEIARGKLVGTVSDLHEKMWLAYKENLLPCGWKGEYPGGKLCVYPK